MYVERIRKELKEHLKRNNLTSKEFAKKLKVDHRTLEKFLRGGNIRLNILDRILDEIRSSFIEEEYVSVPVYESVSAGGGREVFREEIDRIIVPRLLGKPSVKALVVRGDSMYPALVDGAIVGVDTSIKTLRHGQMYVFHLKWKGAVINRVVTGLVSSSDMLRRIDLILRGVENEGEEFIKKVSLQLD